MAAESPGWVNIINTTIAKYFRQEEVNILRSRILLAMMEQKGRISYNHSGTKFNIKVRYRRAGMIPYASDDPITFARQDRHKTAEIVNDRGYVTPEAMGEIDTLQNKSTEAIINLWGTKIQDIEEDMKENFCDELYVDGYATGNEKRLMGIESFFGAAATALSPGFVQPSDTYMDLSTIPGNYGGSWTNGTYPVGSNKTPEYDFWSPILVDYTSPIAGAYLATDRVWKNTCIEAIRRVLMYTMRQKAKEGMVDLLLLELELFRQLKDHLEQFKQIEIVQGEALAMRALGFNVLSVDGVTVSTEFGLPADTGYAFNTMKMDLRNLRSKLFENVGPIYNETSNSYRWMAKQTGNLVCNPRFFGKLKNYTQG